MRTMSKQRRIHKQHESEDISDHMVDRISNLPDFILDHILSFMPTKEVVKTSILSTRWKNLWTSVSNIDIDDDLLCAREVDGRRRPDVTSFVNFVERVLRLRDASNMKKFRLSCRVFRDASIIQSWISYAIMHNVQELDLSIFGKGPTVIPPCVFNNRSLDTLKIEMHCVVELPSHISFSSLKTLYLFDVTFPDDDYAKKLFSGCPVLEKLVLYACMWLDLENLVISSSTLKSLSICDWLFFDKLDDFGGCKIKIDAANLTYFKYTGYLLNEILLNNVPSLVKACIHIPTPYKRHNEIASRTVNLLKRLQYVTSLRLSNDTMKSLIICTDNIPLQFPVFPNLIHLALTKEIESCTFRAVMDMLYFSPILQSISLSEGFKVCMDLGENDRIWLLIPVFMPNSLKTLTLKNFHGNKSEIRFLKHVLKYARVLERMDIWWSKFELPEVKRQTEVKTEFETIERISTACVVNFS